MTWADFIVIGSLSVVFYLVTKWGARRGWGTSHGGHYMRDENYRRRK